MVAASFAERFVLTVRTEFFGEAAGHMPVVLPC